MTTSLPKNNHLLEPHPFGLLSASPLVMTMFQHSNKKCFTIESLVGKDTSNNNASPAGEHEPIRPTALRFTESIHSAPFGTCFQNSGRSIYPSPDMMFQDPGTHTQNSGLPLHPLQMPSQTFFSPHQRDALNFYPWVLRNKFLGHRFPGNPTEPLQCRSKHYRLDVLWVGIVWFAVAHLVTIKNCHFLF